MTSCILNHQIMIQTLLKDYPITYLLRDVPLKVFGCSSFVHMHSHKCGKLEPGWSNVSFSVTLKIRKGYKCYSPNTKHFHTSMDVTFINYEPFYPTPRLREDFHYQTSSWELTSVHMQNQLLQSLLILHQILNLRTQIPPLHFRSTLNENIIIKGACMNLYKIILSKTILRCQIQVNSIKVHLITYAIGINELDDRPIAVRKGTRTCSQHPICNFVSH